MMKSGQFLNKKAISLIDSELTYSAVTAKVELRDKTFVPRGIFISNNDSYIAVVGDKAVTIIEAKSKKIVTSHDLPRLAVQLPEESGLTSERDTNMQDVSHSQIDKNDVLYMGGSKIEI